MILITDWNHASEMRSLSAQLLNFRGDPGSDLINCRAANKLAAPSAELRRKSRGDFPLLVPLFSFFFDIRFFSSIYFVLRLQNLEKIA